MSPTTGRQIDTPVAVDDPADAQERQTVAPTAALYVPAAHAVQGGKPVVLLYPVAHLVEQVTAAENPPYTPLVSEWKRNVIPAVLDIDTFAHTLALNPVHLVQNDSIAPVAPTLT
jgi:hypothetical protein